MSGVSIADRSRFSWLTLRRSLDRVVGRLRAHPIVHITGRTERLLMAPQDLRTADPTRASEIYGGRFAFAGKIVICDGRTTTGRTATSLGPRPCHSVVRLSTGTFRRSAVLRSLAHTQ